MTVPSSDPTGIVVKTSVFPLSFILLLFKNTVTIDGVAHVMSWGENFFPAPAGAHTVTVSFKYLFFSKLGENRVSVNVAPGQSARVAYRSSWFFLLPGKISVAG